MALSPHTRIQSVYYFPRALPLEELLEVDGLGVDALDGLASVAESGTLEKYIHQLLAIWLAKYYNPGEVEGAYLKITCPQIMLLAVFLPLPM